MPEAGDRRGLRGGAAVLAALALFVSLPACVARPEATLLRRYASYEVSDTVGLVDVTAFSTPADAWTGSTRLHQLSASAQAELVEAVAARTTSADALLRELGRPLGGLPARPSRDVDRTRFRRRLVVSAESHAARPARSDGTHWTLRPAGRISRLRVVLGLDPAVARFLGWDRFASRYETVDLGEMTASRRSSAGLDLDAAGEALGRALDRAWLEAGGYATLEEELPLRRRYVSTGTLRSDSLVLLQEGVVGVDLTGNSVVEVEIDVADAPDGAPTFAFEGLFGRSGEPRKADSVSVIQARIVHAPRGTGDVAAELRFEGVVRTVEPGSGDATWAEGDDHARFFVESRTVGDVVLVTAAEMRASVWQLATPGCGALLHVESEVRDLPAVVQVASPDDAFELLRWLRRTRESEIGRRGLYLGPERRLAEGDAAALRVRLVPLNWELPGDALCPV